MKGKVPRASVGPHGQFLTSTRGLRFFDLGRPSKCSFANFDILIADPRMHFFLLSESKIRLKNESFPDFLERFLTSRDLLRGPENRGQVFVTGLIALHPPQVFIQISAVNPRGAGTGAGWPA